MVTAWIRESPGAPKRRRSTPPKEMAIRQVRAFVKGLPQGKEDWDNNGPQSDEDNKKIISKFTLAGHREGMDLESVLIAFGNVNKPDESMGDAVFNAACRAAEKSIATDKINAAMRLRYGSMPSDERLRCLRSAMPTYILILDILSRAWNSRAFEIPLRRKYLSLKIMKLSDGI